MGLAFDCGDSIAAAVAESSQGDARSRLPLLRRILDSTSGIREDEAGGRRKRSQFGPLGSQAAGSLALVFDGYLEVPANGGYTFTLMSRDTGRLEIGSEVVATSPAPVAQVCGSVGNMVQEAKGSIGLKREGIPFAFPWRPQLEKMRLH